MSSDADAAPPPYASLGVVAAGGAHVDAPPAYSSDFVATSRTRHQPQSPPAYTIEIPATYQLPNVAEPAPMYFRTRPLPPTAIDEVHCIPRLEACHPQQHVVTADREYHRLGGAGGCVLACIAMVVVLVPVIVLLVYAAQNPNVFQPVAPTPCNSLACY